MFRTRLTEKQWEQSPVSCTPELKCHMIELSFFFYLTPSRLEKSIPSFLPASFPLPLQTCASFFHFSLCLWLNMPECIHLELETKASEAHGRRQSESSDMVIKSLLSTQSDLSKHTLRHPHTRDLLHQQLNNKNKCVFIKATSLNTGAILPLPLQALHSFKLPVGL